MNNEIQSEEEKQNAQSAGLGSGAVADQKSFLRPFFGLLTNISKRFKGKDVFGRALELNEASFETATVDNCASCDKNDEQLKKCGRCHRVGYCNSNCQGLHWKEHKRLCDLIVSCKVIKCLKESQRDESDENIKKALEVLKASGCSDVRVFEQRLIAFITAASVQEDLQKEEQDAAALQKEVAEKERREEQVKREKEEQELARKVAQREKKQKELAARAEGPSAYAIEQRRRLVDKAQQEEQQWKDLRQKLLGDPLGLTIEERDELRERKRELSSKEKRMFNIYFPTVHGKPQKARPAATPAPASKPGGGKNNGKQKGRAGRGNQNHGSNQQENARALAVRKALSSEVEEKPRDFPPLVPTSAYEKKVWRGEGDQAAIDAAKRSLRAWEGEGDPVLDAAKRSAQATVAEGKESDVNDVESGSSSEDFSSYPMVPFSPLGLKTWSREPDVFGLSSDEADAQNVCDVLSGLDDLSLSSSLVPFSSQGGRARRRGSAGVLDATEQSFFATMARGKKQDANAAMPASDESLVFPPFFEDELGGIPYDLEKMVRRHFVSNLPEGSVLVREFPNGCAEYDVPEEGLITVWPKDFTVGDAKKVAEEAYKSVSAQVSLEGDCCVVKGIGNRNVAGSNLLLTDIPVRLVHNWSRGRWATFFPDMRMPLFNPVLRQ